MATLHYKETTIAKGIRKRENRKGDVSYLIDVTVNGKRRTTTVKGTEADAYEKRALLLSNMHIAERGNSQEALKTAVKGGWTLKKAFDRALTLCWRGLPSEDTNTINSNAALKFFGEHRLVATMTQEDIDDYLEHLIAARNADGTINRKMSALSTILRLAHDRGHLTTMPKLPRRKEEAGRIRFLTEEEEKVTLKWFHHFDKPDHALAVIVLIDTGFRPSELWRLTADNVDLRANTITLWKTKNDKPRTIPMTQRVRAIIEHRCGLHPTGQLWPGADKAWMRQPWENVRKAMNMVEDPDFVVYMLRHTCCSRLIQRGVPLAIVKEWMGHKSITTTMRYAHLAPTDLYSAVGVLEGGNSARWSNLIPEHHTKKTNQQRGKPDSATAPQLVAE